MKTPRDLARLPLATRRKIAWQLRETIYAAKAKPCRDCGNHYAQGFGSRMTFDHLDASKKRFDIGAVGVNEQGELGYRLVHMKTLLAEIAKCEVVCWICHKKREARRARERAEQAAFAEAFAAMGAIMNRAWLRYVAELRRERRAAKRAEDRAQSEREIFVRRWSDGVSWQASEMAKALRPFVLATPRPSRRNVASYAISEGHASALAWSLRSFFTLGVLERAG